MSNIISERANSLIMLNRKRKAIIYLCLGFVGMTYVSNAHPRQSITKAPEPIALHAWHNALSNYTDLQIQYSSSQIQVISKARTRSKA